MTVFGDDATGINLLTYDSRLVHKLLFHSTGKSALIHNLQVPQVGKKVFEQSNIFQEIEYPPGISSLTHLLIYFLNSLAHRCIKLGKLSEK